MMMMLMMIQISHGSHMVCIVITCSLQRMAQMNATLYLTEVIFFSLDIIQCISFRLVIWFGSWRWKIDDGPSPEKEGPFNRHRWTSKYSSSSCPNTLNHFLEHNVSWLDCSLLSTVHSCSKQRCYWTVKVAHLVLCTSNQCCNHFKLYPCISVCVSCSPSCRRNASLKEWNWR